MVKLRRKKAESGSLGKGQRYSSIMLVGERGRVIPFRRFKLIAVSIIALACLSLSALAVIAFLYVQQSETIGRLQREADGLRRETAQLKDEKDVLQAKLVIYEMQKSPEAVPKPKAKEIAQAAPQAATAAPEATLAATGAPAPDPVPAAATPTSTPSINWVLDLQRFDAAYDARRELIRFTVRVVNKTTPRQSFSGRMVLVLKQTGTPPRNWLSLPSGPLDGGKPGGQSGQAFTVQNYRTMDFKLYKQRPPVGYDTATVFIFLSNGQLVSSQDFGFKIELPPTPKPTPMPTPTPTVESTLMPTPTVQITPSPPLPTPPTATPPGVGGLKSGIGADSLPAADNKAEAPNQVQPQATVAPGVAYPVVPSPAPVSEKRPEAEPTR